MLRVIPGRSRRVLLAFALLLSAGAHARPMVVVLDLVPLDAEVSRAVSRQLTASLIGQVSETFSLVEDSEVEFLRSGAERPPDISAALTLLGEAKEHLSTGQNKQAQKAIKGARAILDPLRPRMRDYTPLSSALLYAAVAAMNLNDKKGAQAAFNDLARLRPDYRVNPAEFPPSVLDAFEKARQVEVRSPRGRLVLSSNPSGAKAFVDEVQVGVTPLTVPVSPGEHAIRIEAPGFLNWTKNLTIESYAKAEAQAALEKSAPTEALKTLEVDVAKGTPPGSLSGLATTVSSALKTDAVVAGIVGLSMKGYLVSVGYLPANDGLAQVWVVEIDRSLKDSETALGKISAALAAAATGTGGAPKTTAAVLTDKPTRKVDFTKFALGLGPGGAAGVLADIAKAREDALNFKPVAVIEPPAPSRWWIWVSAGALVVGGGATAAYFATRPGPKVQFELERQR